MLQHIDPTLSMDGDKHFIQSFKLSIGMCVLVIYNFYSKAFSLISDLMPKYNYYETKVK